MYGTDLNGSDMEAFQSSSKYSKRGSIRESSTLRYLVGQMDTVATDVRSIKEGIQQMVPVNNATTVPLSVVKFAIKAFR